MNVFWQFPPVHLQIFGSRTGWVHFMLNLLYFSGSPKIPLEKTGFWSCFDLVWAAQNLGGVRLGYRESGLGLDDYNWILIWLSQIYLCLCKTEDSDAFFWPSPSSNKILFKFWKTEATEVWVVFLWPKSRLTEVWVAFLSASRPDEKIFFKFFRTKEGFLSPGHKP